MTVECHFQQNNDHLQNMDCLALHFKVRMVSINHYRLYSDCNCRFGLAYGD